jgi:hypothetical protein
MNFSTRAILYEIFLILALCPIIFSIFNSKVKTVKNDILALSKRVSRGLTESPEEQVLMRNLFEKLEKSNKIKSPLKLPSLAEGTWSLEYTTSDSILGRNSYKRVGPIIQKIDVKNLKAENSETIDFFGLKINRKVSADLSPLTSSKVAVQFKVFTIGPISFNAPSSFKGELDITYVDEDLRLSRGDKGNIFVLSRL